MKERISQLDKRTARAVMNPKFNVSGGSGPRKIIRFVTKNSEAIQSSKTDHNYTSKTELTKEGTLTDSGNQELLKVFPKNDVTEGIVIKIENEDTHYPPNLCRTCLQIGDIPIYGDDNHHDISEELKTFGAINIKKDDAFPKYLCHSCHYMLQGAVHLRITAQNSEQVLFKQADIITQDNIAFDDRKPNISDINSVLEKNEPDMLRNSAHATSQYTSIKERSYLEKIKSVCQGIQILEDVKITLVSMGHLHTGTKTDAANSTNIKHNVTIKRIAADSMNSLTSPTVTDMLPDDTKIPEDDTSLSYIVQHEIENKPKRKPYVKAKLKTMKIASDNKKIITFIRLPHSTKQAIKQNKCNIANVSKSPAADSMNSLTSTATDMLPDDTKTPEDDTSLSYNVQHEITNKPKRKPYVKAKLKTMKIASDNKKIITFIGLRHSTKQAIKQNKSNVNVSRSPRRKMKYSKIYCRRCQSHFKTREELEIHKDKEHKYKPCQTCRKLVLARSMDNHMEIHRNDVISICHLCGEKFTNKQAAQRHDRKHRIPSSAMISFKCSYCPYRCKDSRTLTLHTRTHTGEKPYQCSQCAQQFATSSNMHRHIKTNHKTRDITCNICNAKFWRKKDMELHVQKIHRGEKPHRCDLCGKCFGDRKTWNKHQRQVHKREKCAYNVTPLYLRPEFQEIVKNANDNEVQSQSDGPSASDKTIN